MIYQIAYYLYFCVLLLASLCGMCRFKSLDRASRILVILVCCAFLNEGAAYYLARKYHNNLPLYAIYCILEFSLLCLYFNAVIDLFKKRNLGVYIGIVGIAFGAVNLMFIQDLNTISSYFLFFEGLMIIGMSLFAFSRLLMKHDDLNLFTYPHFWFISILVIFWSATFLNWGLHNYINLKLKDIAWKVNFAFLILSTLTYGCFGCIFFLYHKMQRSNE